MDLQKIRAAFLGMSVALLCAQASAAETPTPVQLLCMTEYPTTSFVIATRGDKIAIRVFHHNGTQYMPIHGYAVTEITPHDIPTLQSRADLLQKLGHDQTYRIDAAGCQKQGDELFACFGRGDKTTVNGIDVEPFGLYTNKITEQSFAGTIEKTVVNLGISLADRSETLTMSYFANECLPVDLGSDLTSLSWETVSERIRSR